MNPGHLTRLTEEGKEMMPASLRGPLFDYVEKKYGALPEHLWRRYPDYAIFRHEDNRKWFGLVMNIRRGSLGLQGEEAVDVLNVKLPDPLLADLLVRQPGYFRGYHISRGNWVSILLDGTVPLDEVCKWLDTSFLATASTAKKRKLRPPREWIIPANPKYYDVEAAFAAADEIVWKQGAGIRKGDTVFLYVAQPVSAVLFKCLVTETDIPCSFESGNVRIRSLMRIRLLKRYPRDQFTFDVLGEKYGIFAVRGPRGIPNSLSEALK